MTQRKNRTIRYLFRDIYHKVIVKDNLIKIVLILTSIKIQILRYELHTKK